MFWPIAPFLTIFRALPYEPRPLSRSNKDAKTWTFPAVKMLSVGTTHPWDVESESHSLFFFIIIYTRHNKNTWQREVAAACKLEKKKKIPLKLHKAGKKNKHRGQEATAGETGRESGKWGNKQGWKKDAVVVQRDHKNRNKPSEHQNKKVCSVNA